MRNRGLDYDTLRRSVNDWRSYADNYFGDYYPLTPYSIAQNAWIAWQFDQPEKGTGLVQAFRRAESFYESARFKLRGLDPNAHYRLTRLDAPAFSPEFTGGELMHQGILLAMTNQPAAAVLVYQRK
jgi:alpha-galactosidase